MNKGVTDSRFGASEEVPIEGQIWQYSVAGYLGYFGTFDRHSYWTDVPQQVVRHIKRLLHPKDDLIKGGQGTQPATRKRR